MGSWKTHASIIFVLITTTTVILWAGAVYDVVTIELQIAANFALNWTALAYAIYIYKLYDDSKNHAVAKLEAKGIHVSSLEEGVSVLLSRMKSMTDWLDSNRDVLKEIENRVSAVKIEEILNTIDDLTEFGNAVKKRGYKLEGLLEIVDNVDFDNLNQLIDNLVKNQEVKDKYKSLDAPPKSSKLPLGKRR